MNTVQLWNLSRISTNSQLILGIFLVQLNFLNNSFFNGYYKNPSTTSCSTWSLEDIYLIKGLNIDLIIDLESFFQKFSGNSSFNIFTVWESREIPQGHLPVCQPEVPICLLHPRHVDATKGRDPPDHLPIPEDTRRDTRHFDLQDGDQYEGHLCESKESMAENVD